MAVEFMTGATVFAFVSLLVFLVFVYFLYRVVCKVWTYSNSTDKDAVLNIKKEIVLISGIVLFFVFFGSVTQPKLTINPVQNRALMEYQDNTGEVEIVTPPPRTEKMDGFTPLKE